MLLRRRRRRSDSIFLVIKGLIPLISGIHGQVALCWREQSCRPALDTRSRHDSCCLRGEVCAQNMTAHGTMNDRRIRPATSSRLRLLHVSFPAPLVGLDDRHSPKTLSRGAGQPRLHVSLALDARRHQYCGSTVHSNCNHPCARRVTRKTLVHVRALRRQSPSYGEESADPQGPA